MPKPETTNWLELMQQMQQGDRLALLKITRVITGYLTRYRAYQLRDSWDDLTQEVLIALIKGSTQLQNEKAFISYVGTITRNKLVDYLHKQQRTGSEEFLGDTETGQAIIDKVGLENNQHQQDQLVDLQSALTTLSDKEKSVVTAIYIQGHSYEEAAQQLNIPFGSLKRLQTQSLKKLRRIMLDNSQNSLSDSNTTADLSHRPANIKPGA